MKQGEKQDLPSRLPIVVQFALVVVGGYLIWQLSNLLLIIFGAILVAILLETVSRPFSRICGLPYLATLAAVVVLALCAAGGFGVLVGSQIRLGIEQLLERAPDLVNNVAARFDITDFEDWLAEQGASLLDHSLLSDISGTSALVAAQVVNILLILFGGVYLAAHPRAYRQGLIKLFSPNWRGELDTTFSAVASALRFWLVGQLLSMICVGALTTVGLLLLGVPSAFALGFLAGLLEFIPYFGPIASAIPAIAVGMVESTTTGIWVAVLYVVVQQAEWALIVPLIQRRTVRLPPALTIFSILAFGLALGTWGVIFGAPLTVVAFVLVKKLWVRDTLHEETVMPGEQAK